MAETNYLTNVFKESFCECIKSVKTIKLEDVLFYNGYAFTAKDYFTLGAGATVYIHYTANSPTDSSVIFKPLILRAIDTGPVSIDYYVNPDLTPGGRTPIFFFNRRQPDGNASYSTLEFVDAANITVPGVAGLRFTGDYIDSETGLGANPGSSGEGGGGLPYLLDTTEDYVIELTNEDIFCLYNDLLMAQMA
jgi:hypothetical protein